MADEKIDLMVVEEYGYRHWRARLTADEYADLVRRWRTMRNLTCLVPARLVVPQAEEVGGRVRPSDGSRFCHLHESDDSWLEGAEYEIPSSPEDGGDFFMDGRRYTPAELVAFDEAGGPAAGDE